MSHSARGRNHFKNTNALAVRQHNSHERVFRRYVAERACELVARQFICLVAWVICPVRVFYFGKQGQTFEANFLALSLRQSELGL
jgi:hypothetical protein